MNRCFEAGMSKAADDIFNEHRLSKKNKQLCMDNIDVDAVCKKYALTRLKITSVPILIKSMVEHMLKTGELKEYIGDEEKTDKAYALGIYISDT